MAPPASGFSAMAGRPAATGHCRSRKTPYLLNCRRFEDRRTTEAPLKDYLPYLAGALAGAVAAFLLSGLLTLAETPQLLLFGLLPAVGGAVVERIARRR
ncbi:hypothetical protein [Rhizobium binxianense]